jgi:hypothetical protein
MIEVIRVHFADESIGIPDDEIFLIFFTGTEHKSAMKSCTRKGKMLIVFILELPRKAGHYNI